MPGSGTFNTCDYSATELKQMQELATVQKCSTAELMELVGTTTIDVFLNSETLWRNVPSKVWELVLAGYQVLKKWLSYREFELTNRSLTVQEVTEFSSIVRKLAALSTLRPALDVNYTTIRDANVDFENVYSNPAVNEFRLRV